MEDKYFKEIAFVIDDIDEINEHIYEQLAKNMGKLIDIDFAKTPVVDLFTGYQRGLILQQRMNKAIEILKLCNSQCAKETIEILKGDSNE